MSKRRWSKFWWQDHERDAALRLCSLAAQGLWVRLLCCMHEAEPYGYLCLNGQPMAAHPVAEQALTPPHIHQEAEAEAEKEKTLTPLAPNLPDARTSLFKQGLVFLQTATGRPERSTRALLGKWLKMLHDDAATLNSILTECAAFRPAEPVSWLEATVRKRVAEPQHPPAAPQSAFASAWHNVPDVEGV